METASTSTLTIQAIAAYLENRTAKPYRADVDQALWETLQNILSNYPDLLSDFERNPSDKIQQGMVIVRMNDALNGQPATRQTFETLVKQGETKDNAAGIRVENSETTVINSQLNAGGNIHIGNRTNG